MRNQQHAPDWLALPLDAHELHPGRWSRGETGTDLLRRAAAYSGGAAVDEFTGRSARLAPVSLTTEGQSR